MQSRPKLSPTKRLNLFTLHGGICHVCNLKIDGVRERWEIDHVIPRAMIGLDADVDKNMQPIHYSCHKDKTVDDVGDIAKVKRIQAKHNGAHRPRHTFPGSRDSGLKKRMDGTVEVRS